jgi:PAS domain S-box-containing protein
MEQAFLQEPLCLAIVEESNDAVLFSDRDGIIHLWNRGAERMFGYSAQEALGQSLDLIIPENLRQRHWDGYYRVMENGESRYSVDLLSAPAIRKDGTRISTEFSMALIKDNGGTMLGVATIIRDVSARWQREKELKEQLRELETRTGG